MNKIVGLIIIVIGLYVASIPLQANPDWSRMDLLLFGSFYIVPGLTLAAVGSVVWFIK